MRVRVYDKQHNHYFNSEVYAIIDHGWYGRYLILEPREGKEYLKFVDYFDKSTDSRPHPININVITPDGRGEWVFKKGSDLIPLRQELGIESDALRFSYSGFSWLLEDTALLSVLIKGQAVDIRETGHGDKIVCSLHEGWRYVDSSKDVEELMSATGGFHDSCLKCLDYVSGAKVLENNSMVPIDDIRRVTMIYDSQWCKPIEMVFEGVLALNLRPAEDNYVSIVFGASVILKDETVYFYDEYDEKKLTEPESYPGTWIKAFSLRWRLIK